MRKNIGTKVNHVSDWIAEKNTEYGLRPDHPLQRYAKQWKPWQTGNFIRRILEEKPVPPILVAEQDDSEHKGCVISWLIDGKQRISTLERYVNNEFPVATSTRNPFITYQGYKPDTKMSRGKEVIKRDKKGNVIYLYDEDGKKIFGEQVVDIRGKKFCQLPDELQKRILSTYITADVLYECTDDDIQNEIRDRNSGSQMNVAQIGVNALGVNWASSVRNLSNHSFIKNCCKFSENDDNSSKTMRAVGEALMAVNFIEDWNKKNEAMCTFLSQNLTEGCVDGMASMFDILEDIIPAEDDIIKHLSFKEFFVVMANFAYFLSIEKEGMVYDSACYTDFIRNWVREAMFEVYSEADEDDFEDEEALTYELLASKQAREPHVVQERVRVMNEFLDKYLEENCSHMLVEGDIVDDTDDTADTETEVSYINVPEIDTLSTELAERFDFVEKDYAKFNTKLAMLMADVPLNSFDDESLNNFKNRYAQMNEEDKGVVVDDAEWKALLVEQHLTNNLKDDDRFITPDNVLALCRLLHDLDRENQTDTVGACFEEWLVEFANKYYTTRFIDILPDDLLGRANYMYKDLVEFYNEEVA